MDLFTVASLSGLAKAVEWFLTEEGKGIGKIGAAIATGVWGNRADALVCRVLGPAGDLAGARVRFGESLAVDTKLAKENPASAEAQRDLSVSYTKLGDVLVAEGDSAGARVQFAESLTVATKLAKENPASATAQRDLMVSYFKMGRVTGVKDWFQKALGVLEKLEGEGWMLPADRQCLKELREMVKGKD